MNVLKSAILCSISFEQESNYHTMSTHIGKQVVSPGLTTPIISLPHYKIVYG